MASRPNYRKTKRSRRSQNRKLQTESLEARQLLTADVVTGLDVDAGTDPSIPIIFLGATASGTKWEDINANGRRDDAEPGLPGVTIYADQNSNGTHDSDEPFTVTQRDNPDTRFDETGRYTLDFLWPGSYPIREIVPEGYRQTFPVSAVADEFAAVRPSQIELPGVPGEPIEQNVAITVHPFCIRPFELEVVASQGGSAGVPGVEVINHDGLQLNGCGGDTTEFNIEILVMDPDVGPFDIGFLDIVGGDVIATIPVGDRPADSSGHFIDVGPGDVVSGLDFGNHRSAPISGSIEGRKWLDRNGNGEQDAGEPGVGGVTIYLDYNDNGQLDRNEPSTLTMFEDPFTDFDEGGLYSFGNVRPGDHVVREVVPRGFEQTYPEIDAFVLGSESGQFNAGIALSMEVSEVSFERGDETSSTEIEIDVVWPDGCGQLDAVSDYVVIGNTILVDLHGGHSGADGCLLALKTDTATIEVEGLAHGEYSVVATLHEDSADGELATLGAVGEIQLGPAAGHLVTVEAGGLVSDVNFGNRQTGPGSTLSGLKWNDIDGNGHRSDNEPGLGGVTIYIDLNQNGTLDADEPTTVTHSEDVADSRLGYYEFTDLEAGRYTVREVVPEGFRQTFPATWDIGIPPFGGPEDIFSGAHVVDIRPGQNVGAINFGNQSQESITLSGNKWHDINGDGQRTDDEPGLAGVTIYVDLNRNSQLDEGEPSTVTAEDNPDTTDVNELGGYLLDGIKPGNLIIKEVVPDGYRQTFPNGFFFDPPVPVPVEDRLILLPPGSHFVFALPGQEIEGLDFGNQALMTGSLEGTKWLDENGNGTRERGEQGLAGVTIYLDLNFNGQLDEGEPSTVTAEDDSATIDNETGHYAFTGLEPLTTYRIAEVVPEGYRQTYPPTFDFPFPWLPVDDFAQPFRPFDPLPFGNFHTVYLNSGSAIEGLDFGNQPITEPGTITGMKWLDANGNGQPDEDETGFAGVTIFADLNLNGEFDFNEPATVTQRDDPSTEADETGAYTLSVPAGNHLILEVVPRGYEQTHPNTLREVIFPYNLGHSVTVASGETVSNVNFGNRIDDDLPGTISGIKWSDDNGNGVLDRGESPLSGVTVYLDLNDNGELDEDEPTTVTGSNLPDPDFAPPNGYYEFEVAPGDYVVREVPRFGFAQTFPNGSVTISGAESTDLPGGLATGIELTDATITSTSPFDGGRSTVQLLFNTLWTGAVGEAVATTASHDGEVIEVQLNFIIFPLGNEEASTLVDINVGNLAYGDYELRATLREFLLGPDGVPEDDPIGESPVPSFELAAKISYRPDDAHRVTVGPGESVSGLNFGNLPVPIVPVADSQFGEDPHSHDHNEATRTDFEDGHLGVNSFIDHEGDVDTFAFVAMAEALEGEGVGIDQEGVRFELLDGEGSIIAQAESGAPLSGRTVVGETYFLRVSGEETGRYTMDIFAEEIPDEAGPNRAGDTNGDDEIDFSDFLALSAMFGTETDAVFADGDFDGDGDVDFEDFLALSMAFGS